MASYSGTVKAMSDGTTKTFTVKDTPDKVFTSPPDWVWDLVKDNAGAAVSVTTNDGPPETIASVTVG